LSFVYRVIDNHVVTKWRDLVELI